MRGQAMSAKTPRPPFARPRQDGARPGDLRITEQPGKSRELQVAETLLGPVATNALVALQFAQGAGGVLAQSASRTLTRCSRTARRL